MALTWDRESSAGAAAALHSRVTPGAPSCHSSPSHQQHRACSPVDEALGWAHRAEPGPSAGSRDPQPLPRHWADPCREGTWQGTQIHLGSLYLTQHSQLCRTSLTITPRHIKALQRFKAAEKSFSLPSVSASGGWCVVGSRGTETCTPRLYSQLWPGALQAIPFQGRLQGGAVQGSVQGTATAQGQQVLPCSPHWHCTVPLTCSLCT